MLDCNSVNARVKSFDMKHGNDYIRDGGYFLFPDGAAETNLIDEIAKIEI